MYVNFEDNKMIFKCSYMYNNLFSLQQIHLKQFR